MNGATDVAAGTQISSGAVVSPAGFPALPLAIGSGGTGSTTKAAAQTALGLGQDPITSNVSGLTQAITNAQAQIAGSDVTIPALGTYMVQAVVSIDQIGATFAANRTVTFKVRNVTQAVDVVSKVIKTETATTLDQPTHDYYLQASYAGGAVNDHLQCFIGMDVVNSAGTYQVIQANLIAIPLRKS